MAGEDHGASNEERDRVRCRCCGVRWEEHEPDPDRAPCIRHGIVPMQGKILRLEAEVAAQKVAIATLQEAAGPRARTAGEIASGSKAAPEFVMKPSTRVPPYLQPAGEIASGATLAERLREDMVAAGVVAAAGGKVLGMDFKEDWLPTPDDAGYYRYADGSFIRPSGNTPGIWLAHKPGGGYAVGGEFASPGAAAGKLASLGMGPAEAQPERSVDDGRQGEGRRQEEGERQVEWRGQGGPVRGRDAGGAGGGGCPGE